MCLFVCSVCSLFVNFVIVGRLFVCSISLSVVGYVFRSTVFSRCLLSLLFFVCCLSLSSVHSVRSFWFSPRPVCLGLNQTLSEPQCSTEVCSMCACCTSTFEITNLSMQDAMWLWTAISLCGALPGKFWNVPGLYCIYLSIYLDFFLFDKQLHLFVYTQRKIKV